MQEGLINFFYETNAQTKFYLLEGGGGGVVLSQETQMQNN